MNNANYLFIGDLTFVLEALIGGKVTGLLTSDSGDTLPACSLTIFFSFNELITTRVISPNNIIPQKLKITLIRCLLNID